MISSPLDLSHPALQDSRVISTQHGAWGSTQQSKTVREERGATFKRGKNPTFLSRQSYFKKIFTHPPNTCFHISLSRRGFINIFPQDTSCSPDHRMDCCLHSGCLRCLHIGHGTEFYFEFHVDLKMFANEKNQYDLSF